MKSLSKDDGENNETGKKAIGLANNNFARASRFFLATFLSRRCTTATWNFLISRTRSMELVNTAQKLSFS